MLHSNLRVSSTVPHPNYRASQPETDTIDSLKIELSDDIIKILKKCAYAEMQSCFENSIEVACAPVNGTRVKNTAFPKIDVWPLNLALKHQFLAA